MTPHNKYYNKKCVLDGISFDSKKEMRHYSELRLLKKAGKIKNLVLQPKFELQKSFTDYAGKKHRPIVYIADFSYIENDILTVVDCKGIRTRDYINKSKMLLFQKPFIIFKEI